MKWQCGIYQRWLPEYLDGELSGWRRRRLAAHLEACSACRQELADTAKIIAALQAAPVPQPEESFWQEFDRQLHLKLVQAQQLPPSRSGKKPFVLMAAPAMAALVLLGLGYLRQPHKPVLPQLVPVEQVVYAGLDDGLWQGEEFPSWDVNAVLADLSDQEREILWQKVAY